jgi:hypothetical protein
MCYCWFAREVFSTVHTKFQSTMFITYNVFLIKRLVRIGTERVFVWKPKETRPFGRHSLRWEDNIKMDI